MEKLLLIKKQLLLLLFSCNFFCFAQFDQEWVARHNGPGNFSDLAHALAVDQKGNIYVTGSSTGAGTELDYSTIKYNAAGVKLWEARYNNVANQDDEALAIAVDHKGNVYVTGRSTGGETGSDFATVKYNSAGVIQWVARYAGTGPANSFDAARAIKVDEKGNVYVTGESVGNLTSFDYATIKYNPDGFPLWEARYDGPGQVDFPKALALDEKGNVYVTGSSAAGTNEEPELDQDYTTIKYDKNGNQVWIRRYDGPIAGNLLDEARAIALDKSGNIYITGRSIGGFDEDLYDYATVKYDGNGNQKWAARYNGPGNTVDIAFDLAVDDHQNVYVTGASGGEVNSDYATIKYNANGNELWVSRYNGPDNADENALALALDHLGNVYVTGWSLGPGPGFERQDYATVKYNTAGVEQWAARYNGPGNGDDIANDIAVDKFGNVYVTGVSTGTGSGFDYATIKYDQDKKAELISLVKELLLRFRLFNVPNPVRSTTQIYYDLPWDGHVSLQVYDMMGRQIATLVNANRKAGLYSVNFDASALSKGVYSYRITLHTESKNWVQTKKLIVVK